MRFYVIVHNNKNYENSVQNYYYFCGEPFIKILWQG